MVSLSDGVGLGGVRHAGSYNCSPHDPTISLCSLVVKMSVEENNQPDIDDDNEESPERVKYSTARIPEPRYLAKVSTGIRAAAIRRNITLEENQDYGVYVYQGSNSTRCGNRPIEKATKRNNEQMFRQLWRYCALVGDYDSMLILLPEPPANVPATRLELHFKRKQKNSPLLKTGSSETVQDVFGAPMTADGGWVAPKNEMIFSAALSDLHRAHNHSGEYTDSCDACLAKPKAKQHTGCFHHSSSPQLTRKGNPCDHEIYKNSKKAMIKEGKLNGYKETGSMQLLPSDLRDLRTHLLSTPTVHNIQMWITIIVATMLFLRHDEFHTIE